MNKHYFFRDFSGLMGQRYIDRVVFPNTKVCSGRYFRPTAKITAGLVLIACLSVIAACEPAQDKKAGQAAGAMAKDPDGMAIFRQYCVTCHGADGKLQLNGARDLTLSALSLEERIGQITNGKTLMTPFRGVLSPAEIEAVAKYTLRFRVLSPGNQKAPGE